MGKTIVSDMFLVLLFLLALLIPRADGIQCFSPEIAGNVTYHLWPHCRLQGLHDARFYINPGNYSCRAFNGAHLTIPHFEGDHKCSSTCPGGQYLGLGLQEQPSADSGATRRTQRRDYTEAGAQEGHELVCKQCPANTFSVGGGQLVHRWLPEITGQLPEDVVDGQEDVAGDADAPSTEEREGSLPHEFTSTCYGFNTTAFQDTGSMTDAWVEGHLCQPWRPAAHGTHISSGNNRHVPKVRSELHLRLRMVRPGKVWFSFSVNVDESPVAAEACPWLNGDTGNVGQWQCADGTYTNQSWGCNDHGGRHLCPSNFPRMCGQPNQCAGGIAFCCSVDCASFGGPRLCPASGGLQVLLCRNLRVRRCQPMSIRPLPFKDRYYVSSQLSWAWAYLDVPEGWAEIIFVYIRDGAVAGNDRALIGEVGWEGTAHADTTCEACPVGKQSVQGSDRCSSCAENELFDRRTGQCKPCSANQYSLKGMLTCLPRPACTALDYSPVFSECKPSGKRDKAFEWLLPKICSGGVSLPPQHKDVECAPCEKGQYREGAECRNCPTGQFGHGSVGEQCQVCPAGSHAPLEKHFTNFEKELPAGFTTGCAGSCGSEGWRGRTTFLDSGAHHVAPAESWLQLSLNMTNHGGFKFLYSLSCDHTMAKFHVSVDGRAQHLPLTCLNGTGHDSHDRQVWHHIPLSRGPHTIKWIYARTGNPLHFGSWGPFHGRIPGGFQGGGQGPGFHSPGYQSGPGHRGVSGTRDAEWMGRHREGDAQGVAHVNQFGIHPGGVAGQIMLDMARIYRLVIIDVDEGQGAATQCIQCPPGHFSSAPASRCQACPAGKTSVRLHGSTSCLPCPPGTFSALQGSSHCRPCGNASSSSSLVDRELGIAGPLGRRAGHGGEGLSPGGRRKGGLREGETRARLARWTEDESGRRQGAVEGLGAAGRREEEAGATSCACEWVDSDSAATWGTAIVNGSKHTVQMGGERYDLSPLSGVYGPLLISDRKEVRGVPADAQVGLYVGMCSVLVGGYDSRTTSMVFHHPQSSAQVAREGDYPQECVGTYACLSTIKDGIQVPHVPPPDYTAPLMDISVGPSVSGGGVQSFGPLPDFLNEYRIQYFTDSRGQRWRSGGGVTVTLSMGGVCTEGEGGNGANVRYQETKIYIVCSLSGGKGQPELMETCGSQDCQSLQGPCVHHVLWKSQHGCPTCQETSFSEIFSPCVGGLHDVSHILLEECFGGLELPPDRARQECEISLKDLISDDDVSALALTGVMMTIMAIVMYERYRTYKKLYSKYRNMRPGTRELSSEPGVTVATEDGSGAGAPRSSL